MRLVFAGTPGAGRSRRWTRCSRRRPRARRRRSPAPTRRPAAGGRLAASPVAERADERRRPGAAARARRATRSSWPQLRGARRRTAARSSPTARCCRRPRSTSRAHGWVNLHFSLLPAWRGAAPVQHAIMAGDEVTGATTFRLEAGLDAGPVLRRGDRADPARATPPATCSAGSPTAAPGCWSPPSTASRTARSSARAAAGRRRQPRAARSTVADARVDWSLPALRGRPAGPRLHARAGRLDDVRGERLKLGPGRAARRDVDRSQPGELEVGQARRARRHRPRRGPLGDVQPAGKRMLPAADWARGARPAAGRAAGSDPRAPRPATAGRRRAPATPPPRGSTRRPADRLRRAGRRSTPRRLRQPAAAPAAARARGSTAATPRSPPSSPTARCARRARYDAVLAACVDRPLAELDPRVLDAAAARAPTSCSTCGCPSHAAVDTTVDLVRAHRRHRRRPASSTPCCARSPPAAT